MINLLSKKGFFMERMYGVTPTKLFFWMFCPSQPNERVIKNFSEEKLKIKKDSIDYFKVKEFKIINRFFAFKRIEVQGSYNYNCG